MITKIGELLHQNNAPLLKMWESTIEPQFRPYTKHYHSRFEITLIVSGSGIYTTDSGVYPLQAGDIFVFSANELHSITEINESGLVLINLHFEPRFLSSVEINESLEKLIAFCFYHSPDFKNRIPAIQAGFLRQEFYAIKHELENPDNYSDISIHSHLALILLELLRNHNYAASISSKATASHNMLEVYSYIEAHLNEHIKLEDVAKIASLSPNYFSHFFKQVNGISLWDYINAKRVEKAEKLITSAKNNLSILDVAVQCGFNNTVNFNKAFKKHKGITPSKLKKTTIMP